MRLRPLPFLLMLCAGIALAQTATPNAALKGYDANGGKGKHLFVVPIEETIDLGLAHFVERVVKQATPNDIVLLRIKTFGGRVDAAVRIRDALLAASAPTVAYIDRRAISAGALISLACDTIIVSRGASIGAATPVEQGSDGEMKATSEKVVSYMRAEMRATAEAKGRRADLAEAMVDADIEIKGVIEKGKLLTLTSDKALELKLADAVVEDLQGAFAVLNIAQAKQVDAETHWAEKIARFLTDPVVSSLLMTFGFIGVLMELYTPGWGVPGSVGVACLALFFLGQYTASLAGWEELILVAVGLVLLALEIFVIPGFGVAGVTGIICLVVGLAMAMIELDLPVGVSFELGYLQEALTQAVIRLAISVVLIVTAIIVMVKYLPGTPLGRWIVFDIAHRAPMGLRGAEEHGGSLPQRFDDLKGQTGVARTVLRPAGVVEFSGRRVHVVTEGDFVDPGRNVHVIAVDGHRVVVRAVEEKT